MLPTFPLDALVILGVFHQSEVSCQEENLSFHACLEEYIVFPIEIRLDTEAKGSTGFRILKTYIYM